MISFKIAIIHLQLAGFIVHPSLHTVAKVNKEVHIVPRTQKSTFALIMTSISLIVASPGFTLHAILHHFTSDFSPWNFVMHGLTEEIEGKRNTYS